MPLFKQVYLPLKKRPIRMKSIFFLLLIVSSMSSFAQLDTEFWFAVPEVTSGHGDRPISIKVSALRNNTMVKISLPSNSSFPPINRVLNAGTVISIDLTPFIDSLENYPFQTVLNRGIKIEASDLIVTYYEVEVGHNSDFYALKGKKSLGKRFFIPGLTDLPSQFLNPPAYNSFTIVATEDSTLVEISPSCSLTNGNASPFTVVLNKGQTYCCASNSNMIKIVGSKVVANKPIAITYSDDSVLEGSCYDLIGDQIVPIENTDKNYMVVQGDLSSGDRVYVTAIHNNTRVFVDGNSIPVATLQSGQTYVHNFSNSSTFVSASDSIYAFHGTGTGCEFGGAILPPTDRCTGSYYSAFIRTNSDPFALLLVTRSGSENNFSFNGTPAVFPVGTTFQPVTGTNGQWVFSKIRFSTSQIAPGQGVVITNSKSLFHMGILNAPGGGTRYGYFTGFGQFSVNVVPSKTCFRMGEPITLTADTIVGATYLWRQPNGGFNSGRTLTIPNPSSTNYGNYTVQITTTDSCTSTTTYSLTPGTFPEITLSDSLITCTDSIPVTAILKNYSSIAWSNGGNQTTTTVTQSGWTSLTAISKFGCVTTDSIFIQLNTAIVPQDVLPDNICFCEGFQGNDFKLQKVYPTIIWSGNATGSSSSISPLKPGWYFIQVTDSNDCISTDSMLVSEVKCLIDKLNVFTPNNDGVNETFEIVDPQSKPIRYSLIIHNRWGQKVFESQQSNISWDGGNLPDGTYYFQLEAEFCQGNPIKKTGFVKLVK